NRSPVAATVTRRFRKSERRSRWPRPATAAATTLDPRIWWSSPPVLLQLQQTRPPLHFNIVDHGKRLVVIQLIRRGERGGAKHHRCRGRGPGKQDTAIKAWAAP